ncbi:protein FAM107A-like isoform X2 [Poecilia latipinna]|uniref:protein FAM107A-like isoform X2 n=1 Tax=Poecilia latipinna TaxID=48699 RepID=UPI00072EEE3E|nr:PREDICTED: protein FAM107A-like isoform X2 [Poecilia latipinna]
MKITRDTAGPEPIRTGSMEKRRASSREAMVKSASAYSNLQPHRPGDVHRRSSPASSCVPPPDYMDGDEDEDLIKPKKLLNPVKASRSHQELHRELLSSCRR